MTAGYVKVDAQSDFWAIDRDANIRFGLEAIRAGVQHMILVATFEGRASRAVTGLSEAKEAKEAAVDALAEACRVAGVAFTVVRPNAYFKDLTDRAFDTVSRRGEHTVIGDGSRRINPIHGDDVTGFIADCLTDPGRAGREHLVGGPEVFTYLEIGELAAEVLGKQGALRIKSIPVALLRVAAAITLVAGVVSRASRRRAALLRWMIYASTHDAVAPVSGTRRHRDEFLRKRAALGV